MTIRKTWSRWGMPLGVAPSPANAALTSINAQKNKVAAFFILISFLGKESVAPRTRPTTHRFLGAGFDAANSIRQSVTATLKAGQDSVRGRRMLSRADVLHIEQTQPWKAVLLQQFL